MYIYIYMHIHTYLQIYIYICVYIIADTLCKQALCISRPVLQGLWPQTFDLPQFSSGFKKEHLVILFDSAGTMNW